MSNAKESKRIFDTRLKCIIGLVGSLGLAYITGSLAIDTASYFQYIATMALLLLAAKLFFRLTRGNNA